MRLPEATYWPQHADVWHLPGPHRFVEELLAMLWEGTVFVHLPQSQDADALRAELGRREPMISFAPIACEDVVRAPSPWAGLASWLGGDASRRWSPGEVLANKDFARIVIWLHGYERLEPEEATTLSEMLAQLDEARPVDGSVRLPTAVVAGVGVCHVHAMTLDGRRPAKRWWAVVSRLDVAVNLLDHDAIGPVLRDEIVEVAGFDLRLADALAAEADDRPEMFYALCREYARQTGLTPCEMPRRPHWSKEDPGDLAELWARGALDLTDDEPVQHVSTYPGTSEIDRRMWAGQVRILLPSLDALRMELVEISRRHRLIPATSDDEEPDFGELARWLERSAEQHSLTPIARWMRRQRNRLAHLEIVPLEDRRAGAQIASRTGLRWRPPGLAG